jgi:hypothetical protein
MNRNYPNHVISLMLDQSLIKQIVFHEAGHAAAIYLYNKQKQLPFVDFQITIKKQITLKPLLLQVEQLSRATLSPWWKVDA